MDDFIHIFSDKRVRFAFYAIALIIAVF